MKTAITELLNIKFPLLLPGMSWISTPELVAAVSEAGGLGILATGPLSPEETRASIQAIRSKTDKPFGIGCTLLMPGAKENLAVAIEEKVPVVNYSLGKGDELIKQVHSYGGKVIATVTNEKHAKAAEAQGADALLATGHEAAAHGGDVTTMVLVPALVKAVNIPVIATGGVADGKGLLAALSLGASGVAMGSRFATCQESPLHQNVKDQVVSRSCSDTVYSRNFDGIPARYMGTKRAIKENKKPMNFFVAGWRAMGAARELKMPILKIMAGLLAQFDKVYVIAAFGAATKKLKQATIEGNLEQGVQFIGQSQGLIEGQPKVEDLVNEIINETNQQLQSVNSILAS